MEDKIIRYLDRKMKQPGSLVECPLKKGSCHIKFGNYCLGCILYREARG